MKEEADLCSEFLRKAKMCDGCFKLSLGTHKCSICRSARYCRQECFNKNWKHHKLECQTKDEEKTDKNAASYVGSKCLRYFDPYLADIFEIDESYEVGLDDNLNQLFDEWINEEKEYYVCKRLFLIQHMQEDKWLNGKYCIVKDVVLDRFYNFSAVVALHGVEDPDKQIVNLKLSNLNNSQIIDKDLRQASLTCKAQNHIFSKENDVELGPKDLVEWIKKTEEYYEKKDIQLDDCRYR